MLHGVHSWACCALAGLHHSLLQNLQQAPPTCSEAMLQWGAPTYPTGPLTKPYVLITRAALSLLPAYHVLQVLYMSGFIMLFTLAGCLQHAGQAVGCGRSGGKWRPDSNITSPALIHPGCLAKDGAKSECTKQYGQTAAIKQATPSLLVFVCVQLFDSHGCQFVCSYL